MPACVLRGKNLFVPLRPEEGVTAEAFRLLYPQVISDIKVGAMMYRLYYSYGHTAVQMLSLQ